ncbi:MAG: hypothetical protein EPO11_08000 [Gammaproteobacteria bacterium]|nr:MAG: hypothetical protein EPO11_08000 [Gammaproteobacteria bacterium]
MPLKRPASLLTTLISLTSLAVFAQVSLVMAVYFSNHMIEILANSQFPGVIWHNAVIFMPIVEVIMIQFILYVLFIGILWYVTIAIGELFSLNKSSVRSLGIFLWLITVIDILAANCYYFLDSLFSQAIREWLLDGHLTDTALKIIITLSSTILLLALFLTLIYLLRRRRIGIILLSATILFFLLKWDSTTLQAVPLNGGTVDKPNIIFIGFDALRPDFVKGKNFEKFIQSSIYFANTYTPMSRTTPSWTSILTASYPIHNGIRDNMINPKELLLSDTLPRHLKKLGYQTLYATDDRRYNNMGHYIGFDHVMGPSTGVDDFLIGDLNDFPLSNLLINTPLGRWLFPYNYGNHGSSATYDPDSFLQLIRAGLHQRNGQPLFLAMHLNVSGWSYDWLRENPQEYGVDLCKKSVRRADDQLGKLLNILQQNHLLDHSIVVLLSDHGITLGLHGDRIISAAKYRGNPANMQQVSAFGYYNAPLHGANFKRDYGVDTSYGYGGDVLSLKQTHSVLAIKGYGINVGAPHRVTFFTTLMDIGPTILELLKFPPLSFHDGVSLQKPTQRDFFLESGYATVDMQQDNVSKAPVLKVSIDFFQAQPDGSIYVNPVREKEYMTGRQYAMMAGDWLLAHYPWMTQYKVVRDPKARVVRVTQVMGPSYFVLVNLKTGEWTTELNSSFAKTAPVSALIHRLKAFYGDDLDLSLYPPQSIIKDNPKE